MSSLDRQIVDLQEVAGDLPIPPDVQAEYDEFRSLEHPTYGAEFNNFDSWLPGGRYRYEIADLGDTFTHESRKNHGVNYSELAGEESIADFLQKIDALLVEFGIREDADKLRVEVDDLKRWWKAAAPQASEKKKREMRAKGDQLNMRLCAMTPPIYWRMRIMGYKKFPDLAA